jgi:glutamate--cysteine ligase
MREVATMIDVLCAELRPPLTEEAAEFYVHGTVFKTGPPGRVGVELEWLVHDVDRPDDPVHAQRLTQVLTDPFDPPLSGRLTIEPGGQLELSSPPAPLAECLAKTMSDLARLRGRLASAGLALDGVGLDPRRPPVRTVRSPRYAAMERHFDVLGPEGRLMMCSTASVQVCLDAGADEADVASRWHALHGWLPVLLALFAHSPLAGGRLTGWRSTRARLWSSIDPSRTRAPAGADPREAYARWALDAQLLAVRRRVGPWSAPPDITFRDWLGGRTPAHLGVPTLDDLDFHLSTLFPPVRPRGYLELRAIDAQPGDDWRVVTALVAALLDDPGARDQASEAAAPVAHLLTVAARDGLTHPGLAEAALAFTAIASSALTRAGGPDLAAEVDRYAERRTARGRSPADDLLDRWVATDLADGSARRRAARVGPEETR